MPRAAPCADAQTDLCAHPHSPVAHAEGVLKGAREAQGAVACDCVAERPAARLIKCGARPTVNAHTVTNTLETS